MKKLLQRILQIQDDSIVGYQFFDDRSLEEYYVLHADYDSIEREYTQLNRMGHTPSRRHGTGENTMERRRKQMRKYFAFDALEELVIRDDHDAIPYLVFYSNNFTEQIEKIVSYLHKHFPQKQIITQPLIFPSTQQLRKYLLTSSLAK